jgi:phosphoglycolate phosphatase
MNYIFDFDGTIVDSLPAMITVYNKIVRNNENPLKPDEIERLRNMSSRKALKHLGVRWWQYPKLLISGMGDFHALLPEMLPFEAMPEAIKTLNKRGDKLFIVTSNTEENVKMFLAQHKLDNYFTAMETGAGLFNKSKYLRKLIKYNKLKRKQTVYIGDETRDIQAARLAGLKIVSVTWGLNTRHALKRQRPTYLIDNPLELLKIGATE